MALDSRLSQIELRQSACSRNSVLKIANRKEADYGVASHYFDISICGRV
jgi:hypothetical protein